MPNGNIDMMSRDAIINKLIDIVNAVNEMDARNIAMALTGPWGCGKTFILEEMERRLQARNHPQMAEPGYLVIHYNCWKYDYYDEPLVAIVSALTAELDKYLSALPQEMRYQVGNSLAVAGNVMRYILVNLLEKKLGIEAGQIQDMVDGAKDAWKDMGEYIQSNYEFDSLMPFRSAIQRTAKALEEAAKAHTIVMVVDELDRCMPSYSIKVIERLHHLFDGLPNCVVILAVDKGQMDRTVKSIFGPQTDTDSYLKKFIHFEFPVATERVTGSFREKYGRYMELFRLDDPGFEDFGLNEFLAELFRCIDMRMQERLMERLELVHRLCFSANVQDSMDLFLFEVTAAVFMYYERTHRKECVWGSLKRMPFMVNKDNCCGVIYTGMDSFNRHLQLRWGYAYQDSQKHGMALRNFQPEALALLGCWQLYYNDPARYDQMWWDYTMDDAPRLRQRLVRFVECLQEHW